MPPESWVLQLRQRERRLRILLFFNWTRKSTLLLRPGTVASVDRAKFLIILQTPIKNVQELAKEEGEESEAKLRGVIEISEGLRHCRQLARPMEGDFLGVPILYWGSEFTSGQPQQVETNSGTATSSSSSPLAPSARAWRLPKQDCESTITTSLLPFIS